MTATQASRNFAALLDAVEHGDTVLVTRDGVPVGRFVPERITVAEQLAGVMRNKPADSGFGDHLADTVRDLRSWTDDSEREWPAG
jgi:prevent-host-death family protein